MSSGDETKQGKQKQEGGEPSGCENYPNEVRIMVESMKPQPQKTSADYDTESQNDTEGNNNGIGHVFSNMGYDTGRKNEYILSIKRLIEEKQDEVHSLPSDCNIYPVPEALFKEKPDAYTPHFVSIGLFRRDHHHLKPMEARKMHCINNFLQRDNLEEYIEAVIDLEEKARQCYAEVHIKDNFAMVLVVDGCFILELLRSKEYAVMQTKKWSFVASLDMLLLENQLPYFVLEALYQVYSRSPPEVATSRCRELILWSFLHKILGLIVGENDISSYCGDIERIKPKHLLDYLRQILIPRTSGRQPNSMGKATKCLHFAPACVRRFSLGDPREGDNHLVHIRCATELQKAGVKFKKNNDPTSLLDINFDSANGILTIPGLKIDCGTEIIIRNLIAYEQYTDDYSYITEYAAFLDGLINSSKDVELLQKSGIIETVLGDQKEVSRLFNSLLKDVAVHFYYTVPVCRAVEQYYNIPWHKWKASLMLNYFNTPWSFISVFAATILLLLTFTQTFYTAWPYIK